jgi:hypothetical protein
VREEIRKSRRNRGSLHGDFPEIWPLYCNHSVTSADVLLRVGVEMFRIGRQEKKVSGIVNFFADMPYDGARAVTGPFLG